MYNKINIVILAAGNSNRMLSATNKVLHKIANKPLIQYVIETSIKFNPKTINIVHKNDLKEIKKKFNNYNLNWIVQKKQLGTGNAIKSAIPYIKNNEKILILYADVPLISVKTLNKLYKNKAKNGISLITTTISDPSGYGRIIRKKNKIIKIIEEKDANKKQLSIKEINTGIILISNILLKKYLNRIKNKNRQKEYFITDIISIAYKDKCNIKTITPIKNIEVIGINNKYQLSYLEHIYQKNQAKKISMNGVIIKDLNKFNLRGNLKHGEDVEIDINVILEGKIKLGNRVKIGAGCIIKNSKIYDDCIIHPYTIIEYTTIYEKCIIGPFAYLHTNTIIKKKSNIGKFIEIKKTTINKKSKAGHLSYLGNAKIGSRVNIGAGTITCNYNGLNKFKTIIENNVFIGADSQLIAPIKIKKGATIAAGTTVIKNVKKNTLVYNKKKEKYKIEWKIKKKKI
ncbi:N-acetylglucosamine-1-phosphate uridyltransferase / Glucosamine-1-phosphate N-acetyltransferase [Candidatus Purcelliella pentastirinorum]|uniref:Bifunctional protein GlmU n=1 Tax=Candidatus Purcelliella pentastirinorum TaxID=472834 RepID=A0A346DZQ4_9ENTR|nr:bifunctional UDP-N-acetylglucosamine diphosphorylase/glucosamine-1-phosphate N-acetyltransferase GlmU [Candidatus Purcelliella pentastirinorum]AXN02209.1 N-acetylglucosamine-1-phosphate uridyltransferase / Glucosamine-1-phosphate N-acetyltransferase [Candidatus Purcelliella pentastirinorum]